MMSAYYYTVDNESQGEITEKKSRFICTLKHVETEEDAAAFINSIKKKYYDARHNCSAYILGGRQETVRSSDDGEPSGTAGRPMTDIMLGNGLSNVCAVVTRYFGGTLLGTGGLIRAYSQAVKEALNNAELVKMTKSVRFRATISYNELNILMRVMSTSEIKQLSSEYGESIVFLLQVPEDDYENIVNRITDATLSRAMIEEVSRGYYV